MKELSIEDKAKRYDEAIEVARKIKNGEPINAPDGTLVPVAIFPELKENNEERIRKWLIRTLKSLNNSSVQIDGAYEMILPAIAWLEKQGEPKFKVGDWVVSKLDGKARQISEVHYDEYNSYYVVDGNSVNLEEYDRLHHLWTIQDAKDGDVLTYSDSKHIWLCIFKELKNQRCYDYCSYSNKDEIGFWPRSNWNYDKTLSYKPATKEQRDQLEKAMADAGYTFDFEKKELKKIEQKSDDKVEQKFKVGDIIKRLNT